MSKLFKKIYPYFIIISLIIYISIIGNGKIRNDSDYIIPFFINYPFIYAYLMLPLVGLFFGVSLDLLSRKMASLSLKINVQYLIISLILILVFYIPYTPLNALFINISFLAPVLLFQSPIAFFILPVLIGFYLSKGLLSTK